jgi:hypothetical protein
VAAKKGHIPVAFNEKAWAEDLHNATDASRSAATQKRARLERDGQPMNELRPCQSEAPDGTSLPGCAKTYVPQPSGPWGIVYLITRDNSDRLSLAHLAYGLRHPPKGRRASVYQHAHRRLNNAIVARDLREGDAG